MRNDVRLREFSGRAKAVLESLKEAKIHVNFLVFRTVEGAGAREDRKKFLVEDQT